MDLAPLSANALVVRGGRNQPEDLIRGMATHPCGITGVSVHSGDGVTIQELSSLIPHNQIGVTTVGEVRELGGDVVRTSGRSPHHATLTGLTPKQMCELLTPTIDNPAKMKSREVGNE